MSVFYRAYCRIYQQAFRLAANFLPWRKPETLDSIAALVTLLQGKEISRVLLVTDAGILKVGLDRDLVKALGSSQITVVCYGDTEPNPTIANIEEARALYLEQDCQALIALGGGSPMDCAKGAGMRLVKPKKQIPQLRGQLKVRRRLPLLIAIPTTAGTGSETTLAAVVKDPSTGEKYAINDPSLIPHYALLDPSFTSSLPPAITAATGLDALTHAVEAYLGQENTGSTRADALAAAALVFESLKTAYEHGDDLEARHTMQQAAFLAGAAFTRAYVGYVHACAHQMGGMYGTPHGLANAVLLPIVLEAYGTPAERALAEMAIVTGVVEPPEVDETTLARMFRRLTRAQRHEYAQAFIAAIRKLSDELGIPHQLPELKEADIPLLTKRALYEANPLYPVPRIMDATEIEAIYRKILVTRDAGQEQEVHA
ncbi:MAG: iron-containing alcohol dehydrogenase [Coriobacteriia bacterium]|nr:iron-containing alcohol dehydrogenase [Coriobacteriia bacterium]